MIYIVEDDVNIRQMESYALRNSGFETAEFGEGSSFFAACGDKVPELVVMDIMLPGEDGLGLLRRMRSDIRLRRVPVLMVTARTTELDAVIGLDSGADDYITKPFGIMEFIARVKAVFRRLEKEPSVFLRVDNITLDDEKREVTAGGRLCELTYKEYELLKLLMQNAGIVLTRERIMERVWDIYYEGESRTVDMHIKTLRQKLGAYGESIRTVRNVGYKMG